MQLRKGTPFVRRMLCVAIAGVLALADAQAQHAVDGRAVDQHASDQRAVDPMQARMSALETRLQVQQAEIERLHAQVDLLEMGARGRGLSGQAQAQAQQTQPSEKTPSAAADQVAPPQAAQAQAAQQQAAQVQVQTQPAATQAIGQQQQADDAQRREQEKALVVQEHAPLFERRFTIDIGQSYSYYDRRQLALTGFLALDAIFLGRINLDQTKASVFTTDLTARYGVTERINLEANIPYIYRHSRFISGGAGGASTTLSEVDTSSSGLGDVSVAGYYQLLKETARRPDLVASLRIRAPTGREPFGQKLIMPDAGNDNIIIPEQLPTGSGVWSATATLSALRTYDPVILFGSLGYTYNFARSFDDISPVTDQVAPARVKLGNPLLLSAGVALALNDRAALSFSVSSSIAGATHTLDESVPEESETGEVESPEDRDYARVPGSSTNTTALNIGASYLLPSGWNFNGQITSGLTPDAPNFMLSFRGSRSF